MPSVISDGPGPCESNSKLTVEGRRFERLESMAGGLAEFDFSDIFSEASSFDCCGLKWSEASSEGREMIGDGSTGSHLRVGRAFLQGAPTSLPTSLCQKL